MSLPANGQCRATNAEITAVDRTTLQPIGTRSFVTSYIHAAIFDGQHIWFGYAGDNDIDMHKVAKLTPDFTNEQQFDTCVEPTSVHQDGDALIVLCTENGMIAKAMRINRTTGQIEAQTTMLTKWNDMYFHQSALFHGELIIFGGGHWGDSSDLLGREMQVRDPKTLASSVKSNCPLPLSASSISSLTATISTFPI